MHPTTASSTNVNGHRIRAEGSKTQLIKVDNYRSTGSTPSLGDSGGGPTGITRQLEHTHDSCINPKTKATGTSKSRTL